MAHRSRAGATQVGVTRAGAEESSARANGCAGGGVGTYRDCGHRNTSSSNGQAVRTSASQACALLDPGAGGLYVLAKASCKSGDRTSRVLTSPHDGRAPNPFRAWHSKAERRRRLQRFLSHVDASCGNPVRGPPALTRSIRGVSQESQAQHDIRQARAKVYLGTRRSASLKNRAAAQPLATPSEQSVCSPEQHRIPVLLSRVPSQAPRWSPGFSAWSQC